MEEDDRAFLCSFSGSQRPCAQYYRSYPRIRMVSCSVFTSLTPVIRFIEGIVVGEIKEKNSNLLLFIERALWLVASVGVAKQFVIAFFRQQSSSFRNLYCKDT